MILRLYKQGVESEDFRQDIMDECTKKYILFIYKVIHIAK